MQCHLSNWKWSWSLQSHNYRRRASTTYLTQQKLGNIYSARHYNLRDFVNCRMNLLISSRNHLPVQQGKRHARNVWLKQWRLQTHLDAKYLLLPFDLGRVGLTGPDS